MLLLALDTSTPAVAVAVHDGLTVRAEGAVVDGRRHSELLTPQIRSVLAQADVAPGDLTVIAAGVGPGPFTGLRVGVVTALALAAALDIPVFGVCSLDAIAWATGGRFEGSFGVVTDARRKEVYWARYEDRRTRLSPAGVAVPAVAAQALQGLPVVGPAAELYPMDGWSAAGMSAGALAEVAVARLALGGEGTFEAVRPLYLRRPDAQPSGGRKRVLG